MKAIGGRQGKAEVIGKRAPDWGKDWGSLGEIPASARPADSDATAAMIVAQARRADRPIPPVVLTGGDLARTLGLSSGPEAQDQHDGPVAADQHDGPVAADEPDGPMAAGQRGRPVAEDESDVSASGEAGSKPDAGRLKAATGVGVAADVGAALIDGRLHWFVAHLVARRSWWRGRLLVVANASFIGDWNAAPRAHPGDGRLDVFDTDPPLTVRLAARRRLPSGTHVPHPSITQRRTAAAQFDLSPALDVYVDGRHMGRARTLSVRVEPAALSAWIPARL